MQKLNKGPVNLTFRLDAHQADKSTRTVEAAISNDTPVEDGMFGKLSLAHTPDAIDMSRAKDGLVMLFNHDTDNPIGRVENVRLDPDATLRGTFKFSAHESAERYWSQVEEGTLTDISVGANVVEFEEGEDQINITRWTPFEASIVSIGRIPGAKVGFSHTQEAKTMSDDVKTGEDTGPENKTAAQVLAAKSRADRQQQASGIDAERKRVKAIRSLFAKPAYDAPEFKTLLDFCLDEGLTLSQAQSELLDFIGFSHESEAPSAVPFQQHQREPSVSFGQRHGQRSAQVSMGASHEEKFYKEMTDAVGFRMGVEKNVDTGANQFVGLSTGEMARRFAAQVGIAGVDSAPIERVVAALMSRDAPRLGVGPLDLRMQHATGDFPGIFANMIDKAIRVRYEQEMQTWRAVARVGSVADFKQASRPALSAFSDLLEVPEGAEYKHGTRSDVVEYLTASKFGRMFALTREALINDDLQAMSDTASSMADAANRNVGDYVWNVFINNPTLNQDGTAVFDALHNNIGTAGAPSVTTLSEARKLMRLQTDPSGQSVLNLAPSLLIVGPQWETEARTLVTAETLDYEVNSTDEIVQSRAANQFGNLQVVVENRFTGTDWYMQAPPNGSVPFIEVAFVRGQETPEVMTQEGWNVDGIEYKVRQEFGVAPLAYQPVVKNDGA